MSKFNFIKNREKLSDKEIESNMDFNKFMKGYQAGNGWLLNGAKSLKLFTGVAVVAVVAGIVFLAKNISSRNDSPPFINPPMEEVRIKPETYSINNTTDTILTYKTGSSIHIPSSAFIDIAGNDVKGTIEIHYREFHDAFDLFLSGIPMEYDSAGITYQLETGGMIECLAFQDNKPLALKAGKEMTINMVSHTSEDNYNIYRLDTVKRNWEYMSRNTKASGTNLPLFDSEVVRDYEAEVNNNVEPAIPSIAKATSANIELDYDKTEFPELAVFEGIKFEVDPSDKNFDPSLANETWEDVSIKKTAKSKQYTLTFIKGSESHEFKVAPVLEEIDYEKAQQEYIKKQEEYFVLLEKKTKDKKYREQVVQANYEKLMNVAQWSNVNARVNEFIEQENVNYAQLAIRTFQIKSLGISNCDRPYVQYMDAKSNTGAPVTSREAFFTDKKGNIIEVRTVYLIPADRNTIYGFPAQGNKVAKFNYMTNAPYTLMAVTQEGYPAYISEDEFKNSVSKDGDINFTLTVSTKKYKDAESLKDFMKMN